MILITGATGLVGAHLMCELIQKNDQIRAIYRNKSSIEKTRKLFQLKNLSHFWDRINWVEADITDIQALSNAFNGVDEVYHCAAMVSFQTTDFDYMCKVNIEGTANVVNIALANQVKKFCHISSVATLDEINKTTNCYDETSQWNPNNKHSDYAISKNGAEIEVWRGIQEGLPAVIVNPAVIFGDGFENQGSGLIANQIEKGMPFYTTGLMAYIGVKDLVTAMIFLMENNHFGERFVLAKESRPIKEVFTAFANHLNKKPPYINVPKSVLHIAAVTDGILTAIIPKKERSLTHDLVKTSFSKDIYDCSKYLNLSKKHFSSLEDIL